MNNQQNITNTNAENHHLISPTAKLVAHLRADTDIPYSKQIDEICEAGKTTEELFGNKETLGWMSAMLELRYKSLSELLKKEMSEKGIKQVLELACGIQPRGIIVSADPEITYIETDLPEMAEEKKSLVAKLDPTVSNRENYHVEALNILDQKQLEQVVSKFEEGPVAIINEGLLPYLTVDEKRVAATNIYNVLSKKGGVWITPDISNSGRMKKIIELFPGSAEATAKISSATGRNLKENGIGGGDKEATLQFYRDIGFNVTEYTQKSFVPVMGSLMTIQDKTIRSSVDSILSESNIWTLEVK